MAVQDKDKLVSLEDLKTAYDDLDGGISEVRNTLNQQTGTIINYIDKGQASIDLQSVGFKIGRIKDDGEEVASNNVIKSDPIYVLNAQSVLVEFLASESFSSWKVFYFNKSGTVLHVSIHTQNGTENYVIPDGTEYIRLTIENWNVPFADTSKSAYYKTFTLNNLVLPVINKSDISSIKDYISTNLYPVDLSLTNFEKGGINGEGVEYATNNVLRSAKIKTSGAKKVIATFDSGADTFSSWKVYYFNSSNTLLHISIYTQNGTEEYNAPNDTDYIRLAIENWNEVFADTSKKSYFKNLNYYYHIATDTVQENLDRFTDGAIYGTNIESVVKNEVIKRYSGTVANYQAGQTYEDLLITNLSLESGKTYTLYCGHIVGDYSPVLRVVVQYSDDSIDRFNVDETAKINTFTVKNKPIIVQRLLAVSITSGTSASAGKAYYYNIILFNGNKLVFRDQYDFEQHIPNYYIDHLLAKEEIIRGHQSACSYNGDGFVFITDTHYEPNFLINDNYNATATNTNYSIPMVKHIIANTAMRFIAFGGDLINEAPGVDAIIHGQDKLFSAFDNYAGRLMCIVGNHEYYSDLTDPTAGRPTVGDLYGSLIKFNEDKIVSKGAMDSYAFDNPIQKIRYFMISCGRDVELSTEQLEWFMNELTQTPSGYRIIVIGHAFINSDMTSFRGDHQYLADALDAVNARTSYTYNGITYDYSNLDAKVICIITGHMHMDGSITTTGGIPCICTTCDSWSANYESGVNVPRDKTTVDSQAFDVIQIDFANKKIYCTRIGYGSDREFSYQ